METTLSDTCDVSRLSTTVDEFGSGSQSLVVVGSYPCRANVKTAPSDTNLGSENVVRSQWEVSLPLDADVTDIDVLTVGANTYTVLDTDKGRTGALLLVARCRKDV